MSLTGSNGLFAAVHEDGINDFVRAFFTARPRYLRIGSPFFVSTTTVNETRVDAIDIGGGVHFVIDLEPPRLDLHPNTLGFSFPPGSNQFSIEVSAQLTVLCRERGNDKEPRGEPLTTKLRVCAMGHIERMGNELCFIIDDVEIKEITPDTLESILECVFKTVLSESISGLRIPYRSIFLGLGTLVPVSTPFIETDQLKASANFI